MTTNVYYNTQAVDRAVTQGRHREIIGGMWDEVGSLQIDYLRSRGLRRDMKVLDLGCGCLRGGVKMISWLDAGNYYGVDLVQSLLDCGYDIELRDAGLQHRLPRGNLMCNADFDATGFGTAFDVVIAQSVFTHLPLNDLHLALDRLSDVLRPGGAFFATVFSPSSDGEWCLPHRHHPGGVETFPNKDPFHIRTADLASSVHGRDWRFDGIEGWDHPRDQRMCRFTFLGSGKQP